MALSTIENSSATADVTPLVQRPFGEARYDFDGVLTAGQILTNSSVVGEDDRYLWMPGSNASHPTRTKIAVTHAMAAMVNLMPLDPQRARNLYDFSVRRPSGETEETIEQTGISFDPNEAGSGRMDDVTRAAYEDFGDFVHSGDLASMQEYLGAMLCDPEVQTAGPYRQHVGEQNADTLNNQGIRGIEVDRPAAPVFEVAA
jgi:hypothetical protein